MSSLGILCGGFLKERKIRDGKRYDERINPSLSLRCKAMGFSQQERSRVLSQLASPNLACHAVG